MISSYRNFYQIKYDFTFYMKILNWFVRILIVIALNEMHTILFSLVSGAITELHDTRI
jgi:hypothetical protein